MKIIEKLRDDKLSLSFEVFPPKTSDNFESVMEATESIADLDPSFMSVTYGAGGGTSEYTALIASRLLEKGVTPIAHLTCISSTKSRQSEIIEIFGYTNRCFCGIILLQASGRRT